MAWRARTVLVEEEGLARALEAVVLEQHGEGICPGRKPAFLVFKRPARPYKSPIQNGFSYENAKGA
jgi:hypothetical protein